MLVPCANILISAGFHTIAWEPWSRAQYDFAVHPWHRKVSKQHVLSRCFTTNYWRRGIGPVVLKQTSQLQFNLLAARGGDRGGGCPGGVELVACGGVEPLDLLRNGPHRPHLRRAMPRSLVPRWQPKTSSRTSPTRRKHGNYTMYLQTVVEVSLYHVRSAVLHEEAPTPSDCALAEGCVAGRGK